MQAQSVVQPVQATTQVVDEVPPAPVGGCESYRPLIEKYDWDTSIAMAVMEAESGCEPTSHNPNASTGDDSWGLFQVNLFGNLRLSRPSSDLLVIPEENIKTAHAIYIGQGWKGWGAYKSGAYLKFLK